MTYFRNSYLVLYGVEDDMPAGIFFCYEDLIDFLGRDDDNIESVKSAVSHALRGHHSQQKTLRDSCNKRYNVYRYRDR